MTTSDQTQEILYVISNHRFPSDNYGNDDFLSNWPMLYILENGKRSILVNLPMFPKG